MLTDELIKLNNLQLAAKLVSEQVMLGIHGSKRSGIGIEFEQYRHYQPGDDPKRIDWKLFARTEKHLIRESATESNLSIRLILDLSGSMNYAENGVSRLHYAKLILASLAYLGYRQNDEMSLYGLQAGTLIPLVPSGKQAFQRILYELEKAVAKGEWQPATSNFSAWQQKQKELLIVVSDLLQVNNEWIEFIRQMANPKREVLLFQVLGQEELDFNLTGFFRFKDLENGREVELDAASIRETVRKKATEFFRVLDEALLIPHVRIWRCSFNDSLAPLLIKALKKR